MAQTESQGLIPLFTAQYSTNVELLLQQRQSKLRGRLREGSHVGKMASPVNQVGSVTAKAPTGRFAPLGRQDADTFRPWVFPQPVEIPQLIDEFDQLETSVDIKSGFVEAAAAAIGRAWDDAIIAAFFGSIQLGADVGGLSAQTFSTTNFQVASTFGSSAASGLTVAKIIEAKRILEHYHNDLEMDRPTMVIGSQQHSDLLNQVTVVSTEFRAAPVMESGMVRNFLGFDIVMSERLSTASNVRNIPVFVKSGMYLGMWQDMTNRIDQRTDLSSIPWQLYTKSMYGSTRLQGGKVVSILCADTSGTDITP
jgi:hypothetical protein